MPLDIRTSIYTLELHARGWTDIVLWSDAPVAPCAPYWVSNTRQTLVQVGFIRVPYVGEPFCAQFYLSKGVHLLRRCYSCVNGTQSSYIGAEWICDGILEIVFKKEGAEILYKVIETFNREICYLIEWNGLGVVVKYAHYLFPWGTWLIIKGTSSLLSQVLKLRMLFARLFESLPLVNWLL